MLYSLEQAAGQWNWNMFYVLCTVFNDLRALNNLKIYLTWNCVFDLIFQSHQWSRFRVIFRCQRPIYQSRFIAYWRNHCQVTGTVSRCLFLFFGFKCSDIFKSVDFFGNWRRSKLDKILLNRVWSVFVSTKTNCLVSIQVWKYTLVVD